MKLHLLAIMVVIVLVFSSCAKFFASDKVPIMSKYPEKIVYTTDSDADIEALRADCRARGGEFNQCGSMCAPNAAVCAEVCAYTCEFEDEDEEEDEDDDEEDEDTNGSYSDDLEDEEDGVSEANIKVTSPTDDSVIGEKLEVTGEARVFENSVNYRLKDDAGNVLAQGVVIADAPDIGQFGPFEISTTYDEPSTAEGVLEVFTLSAKDGSEIDKVTVDVQFS